MNDLIPQQAPRNPIRVSRMPFWSFVKFAACLGFSIGIVIGTAACVFSFTGELDFKINDRLGGFSAEGFEAGLLFLACAPVYFGVVTTLLSFPAYIPFSFVFHATKGISLVMDNPVESEDRDSDDELAPQ